MEQVLNQDETPLLYSLVFGEGVVNDATSVVLFNAIQSFDLTRFDHTIALKFMGNFLYLFITSTLLGAFVRLCPSPLFVSYIFWYVWTDGCEITIPCSICRLACSVLTSSKSCTSEGMFYTWMFPNLIILLSLLFLVKYLLTFSS